MAGGETIATEGACHSWLSGNNILPVQGIIFTLAGTGHTIGATALIDGQPERVDIAGQVDDGSDGTVGGTVDHSALFY